MLFAHFLFLLLTISPILCQEEVDYRLPDIYKPVNYLVYLNVTEEAFTESYDEYSGIVAINLTVTEDTKEIKLHASHDDLNLNMVTVSETEIEETDYSIDETTDILTISYADGLTAGEYYDLIIYFTGNLSDDLEGFYKSSYQDDSGETRYLATTQFEVMGARRAFPCFDEPAFKATFEFFIVYPIGYNVMFNTPGSLFANDSVSETFRFEATPVMSTYLLAFLISDFTCTEGGTLDGVDYQVCSRDNTKDHRGWAVEIEPEILQALDNFTGYSYSNVLTKMDQAAIPDFAAGAMENWGLVMYREGALLWNSEENSNSEKQNILLTIMHEFAHQWFGNLVTMNWWSELFLNEGLATYCEFLVAQQIKPEWQLDKQFMVNVFQPVMLTDSLETASSLVSEVNTASEADAKFDAISYNKGASIMRMVEHIMGTENFKAGLNNYIELHKFGTVVAEDLWDALNDKIDNSTSKLSAELSVVMENWTYRSGFPIVYVVLEGSEIKISQERCLLNLRSRDATTKWYVPITYTTSVDENKFSVTSPQAWLMPESDVTITLPTDSSWIIVNNQQTGFYRVNYDDTLWSYITAALLKEDFDGIDEYNRAQIVDDLFNLARSDKIAYAKVLSSVEFLANDTSYFTWYAAFNGFQFLLGRIGVTTEVGQAMVNHILRLMNATYESVPILQLKPDDQIYTLKQALVLSWACKLGKQDCIEYSQAYFAIFKSRGIKLDPNLRSTIYCAALRYSTDRSDWDFVWDLYVNGTAYEQWYLLSILGCSRDEDILEGYLNKTINDDPAVKSQDAASIFYVVYTANPIGVDVAFKFLMENYEAIAERYQSLNAAGSILQGIAARFTTREQIEKLRDIVENGNLPEQFLAAANTALETAEVNVEWIEEFTDEVKEFYGLPSSVAGLACKPLLATLFAIVVLRLQ